MNMIQQEEIIKGTIEVQETIICSIISCNTLTGVISIQDQVNLNGCIKQYEMINGKMLESDSLSGVLSMPVSYNDYSGDYDITPRVEKQTLETADKHMVNDVTVQAIPYFEVSNQQNGKTVIIGG